MTVEEIEYDPNRSARIARVKDQHGLYHYILADTTMKKGKVLRRGEKAAIETSNRMPLAKIPVGTQIYAIEINPEKARKWFVQLVPKHNLWPKKATTHKYVCHLVKYAVSALNAKAALGVVGNVQHQNVKIGSAGRNRRKGIRPSVRGVVMNAADHPHGGGDGGTTRYW